ncbi:hypothetical protein ACP26L_10955 [Paenibacillus sp. S-38]|uniref:hypothetical protein n=1 Tax=Paenibacillus sp. S-38 TaxID=3416710 RepID=UPI003CEB3E2A
MKREVSWDGDEYPKAHLYHISYVFFADGRIVVFPDWLEWIFVGKSKQAQMLQDRAVEFCGYVPDINRPCF